MAFPITLLFVIHGLSHDLSASQDTIILERLSLTASFHQSSNSVPLDQPLNIPPIPGQYGWNRGAD